MERLPALGGFPARLPILVDCAHLPNGLMRDEFAPVLARAGVNPGGSVIQ